MKNNNRNAMGKKNACLAVLALALLAPLTGALGAALGSAATSNATLEAFADGTVSKTLTFGAGAQSDSSIALRLPHDAAVARAALDARVAANSAVSSGAMVFDVGADGTADATASLSVLGATRVTLPAESLNAYLRAKAQAAGSVDIPVKITAAAGDSWSIVLDGLVVEYSASASAGIAPTFTGEVRALAVVAGEANRSAVDLAANFEGSDLTFSAQLAADAKAAASGVSVVMNGSKVKVLSENANWWGEVAVKFAAADAYGQAAVSNDVAIHVTPAPVTMPTTRTETRVGAETVLILGCGSPAVAGTFTIPADAVVISARMSLASAPSVSALGGSVGIIAGADAVAELALASLPVSVELNASTLNARLHGQAAAWGLVDLELGLDVCPSGAVGQIQVSSLTVTYTRGNASAPTQVIAAIAIDGAVTGNVEADRPVRVALETNGTLGAGTQVEWFVDGALVGSGPAAEGVSLCSGNHTVEARATTGLSLRVFRATVNSQARADAEAAIAFNGIVTTAVRSGSTLIVELRTARPMSADAQVEWFVDGRFVGRGQVLANLTFEAGVHQVEARATENGTVHAYRATVTASAAQAPANLTMAIVATGALALAAAAAVAVKRRRA